MSGGEGPLCGFVTFRFANFSPGGIDFPGQFRRFEFPDRFAPVLKFARLRLRLQDLRQALFEGRDGLFLVCQGWFFHGFPRGNCITSLISDEEPIVGIASIDLIVHHD